MDNLLSRMNLTTCGVNLCASWEIWAAAKEDDWPNLANGQYFIAGRSNIKAALKVAVGYLLLKRPSMDQFDLGSEWNATR